MKTIVRRIFLYLANIFLFMKESEVVKPEVAFGQVLRQLRKSKKISQEKLAEMSKLDRTFISLLERGLRQPSLSTILQLAQSLQVSPVEMIAEVVAKIEGRNVSK